MIATNGWPGKPGVPLHPDKDGWHWISGDGGDPEPFYWNGIWQGSDQFSYYSLDESCRYLGPCLTPDEAAALQKRVAELEGALKDAAASVGEWGAYASQYLQDKWDLPREVARYIAIAEGKNDAALTGGKE